MNVSIAMTSFNGEAYIEEQLESILVQLSDQDEIIICDDGSVDSTLEIIDKYREREPRIKLYENGGFGVVRNFESALQKCNNEIIFFSDQDDIWYPNKVYEVKKAFENSEIALVLHNATTFCEGKAKEEILITSMKHGILKNIIKSCYWGCCMAFRREFLQTFYPFPEGVIAYDQWIGLLAESKRVSRFVDEPLLKHRKHRKNVTKPLHLKDKILFRINIASRYLKWRIRWIKN